MSHSAITDPSEPHASAPFYLGDVLIEPDRCVIVSGADEVSVQPKVMDVLLYLAANHGQLVRKEALFEHIWPRGFVVDGVLKRCIFQLRRALADDAKMPRFIETTPRRGYRLLIVPTATQPRAGVDLPPAAATHSPYRGLLRYEPDDARYFVGRTANVRQALGALDAQLDSGRGFVLLLGPSGCGKSSLARAGVLPALLARSGARMHHGLFQFSEHGSDPFVALAATLLSPAALGSVASFNYSDIDLADGLRDSPDDVVAAIAAALSDANDAGDGKLALLFDQFEELLVSPDISESERDGFFALLYALARSGSVWLVATLRSDFYALFARYPLLCQLRSPGGQIDVDFPGPSQITEIVREPARMAGLRFEADAQGRRLDERIIDDAATQADSLPLLSFLFEELYKHRDDENTLRIETYEALGGLQGCLTRRAESVYQALSRETRGALGRVFAQLIRADADNAGRVVAATAPVDVFEGDPAAIALVNSFVDARLFTAREGRDGAIARVKFAHEALFRFWPRAQDWVQSNYADLRFRRWLEQLALRWDGEARSRDFLLQPGKPLVEASRLLRSGTQLDDVTAAYIEQSEKRSLRSERLRRITVAMLGALALVAIALAIIAGWQNQRAQLAQQQAQTSAAAAQQTSDFLVSVFDVANPSKTVATPTARELLDQSVNRISDSLDEAPAVRARVLKAMGQAYRGLGEFQRSRELLEQSLAAQRESSAAQSSNTVLTLSALANVLIELDQKDQAQARLDEAMRENARRPDVGAEAEILNEQGRLHFAKREYAESLDAFARRLELLATLPETDLLEQASTLNNVAAANWGLGNLDRAQRFYEQAIAQRRAAAGDLDVELADYIGNLGVLLQSKGDLDGAETRFQEALSMRIRLFGEDNADSARTLSSLGMLYLQQERAAHAADVLLRAVTVANDKLGPNHDLTALTGVQLAEALLATGDFAGALRRASAAHAVNRQIHGADHLNFAYSETVIGIAQLCGGDGAARQRVETALAAFAARLPASAARPSQFERRARAVSSSCPPGLGANH